MTSWELAIVVIASEKEIYVWFITATLTTPALHLHVGPVKWHGSSIHNTFYDDMAQCARLKWLHQNTHKTNTKIHQGYEKLKVKKRNHKWTHTCIRLLLLTLKELTSTCINFFDTNFNSIANLLWKLYTWAITPI